MENETSSSPPASFHEAVENGTYPLAPETTTQRAAKDIPRPVNPTFTIQPHRCSFGLACTSQIDDLHFHRRRVSQLNATARNFGLPVRNNSGNLRYFRLIAQSIALDLSARGVDVVDVLRGIQSPEYWEVENEYLRRRGCLEGRQGSIDLKGPPAKSAWHGPRSSGGNTGILLASSKATRGTKRKVDSTETAPALKRHRASSSLPEPKRPKRTRGATLPRVSAADQPIACRTRSQLDLRGDDIRTRRL